jgi:hypothetical protein
MTLILPLACLVTGAITTWVVQLTWVFRHINRHQERMQRKVDRAHEEARYWQGRAEMAEDRATLTGPPGWPPAGIE